MEEYIKKMLKKILTPQQRIAVLKIYDNTFDRWICWVLSYKLILVLGCQRSGTTLLYMLITSHPNITGKDESESGFTFPRSPQLLDALVKGRMTCYKLPTQTPKLNFIMKRFPFAKILWIKRDPLSVVSSMRSLQISKEGENWIQTCGYDELKRHAVLFFEINNIDFEAIDQISLGAYIYKYKLMTSAKYVKSKLKTYILNYEELLENPKKVLSPILKNIGLMWNDTILRHQETHRGKRYLGGNIGDKALDKQRKTPDLNLDDDEIKRIEDIVKSEITG